MSRRNIINTDYVHTIHTVIGQIGIPFHSKVDTVQNLAEEIEVCYNVWGVDLCMAVFVIFVLILYRPVEGKFGNVLVVTKLDK